MGVILLAMNLITYFLLYNSRVGRAWTAIGSSVNFAKSIGIDVVKYRLGGVVLSSFFAALSGSYLAGYQLYIVPDSFGFYQSMMVQMSSLVGGLGYYLLGPMIGAALMTFIPQYLQVTAEIEPILTAAVILLVIIFIPFGVLGLLDKFWRSFLFAGIRKRFTAPVREP